MTSLNRFFRRLWSGKRGNVSTVVALSMLPIVAAIGGGIDFGNVLNARARLQDAADSAAIAAALDSTGILANQQSAASKAFTSNIATTNLANTNASGSLTVSTVNNVQTMNYAATAHVPTYILGIVGMKTIDIAAIAKAGVTINSAEIAFVLDNTGSMSANNKMTQLKSSLDAVLATLVDSSGKNLGNTEVALVPFDTQVALNNVTGMTGYATGFSTVTAGYTCTSITTAQCAAITANYPAMCSSISSNYGATAAASCAANVVNYTRVSGGYTYVYSTTYFDNPSYTGCTRYCTNAQYYRYIEYYRVAAYSLGSTTATQSGSSSTQGYYDTSGSILTPSSMGYNGYTQTASVITYGVPTAGGYNSGSTVTYMDNNTINSTDSLLGVGTNNWSGCVIDRAQPYDVQSDSPTATNANTLYPAAKCATPSLLPIMDLTTDISAVRTYAAKMTPAGNTNITIGIQWGMEVLSPNAPFTGGASFTDPSISKYMIVLTDGLNTQNRWTTTAATIDARTALACTNAKALGITVFTVRLEQGNSAMLQACASQTGYYYNLSNASEISGALGSIMKSIKKIRLTR